MNERGVSGWLVCRVQDSLCALALAHVVETLRPLPVEPLHGAAAAVLGVSMIRGVPVPVVDAGRLLTGRPGDAARFVTLAIDGREVALAVSAVQGVREALPAHALPPLLQGASQQCVEEIGRLDNELLLVLDAARLVPDDATLQVQA